MLTSADGFLMVTVYSFLFSALFGSVTIILYVVSPSNSTCAVVVWTSDVCSPMLTRSPSFIVTAVISAVFAFWPIYALYMFPIGFITVPYTVTASRPKLISEPF